MSNCYTIYIIYKSISWLLCWQLKQWSHGLKATQALSHEGLAPRPMSLWKLTQALGIEALGLFVSICHLSFWCWLVKSFRLWRGLNIKHHQALWVTLAPFWLANLCGLESQDLHKVWQSLGTTEMPSTFWPECLTNFPNHRSLGRF